MHSVAHYLQIVFSFIKEEMRKQLMLV